MERYNNIIELKEISSTNDYALELARTQNIQEFTVIRTDFQTKGRGQIGNHWVADRGKNLLFSVILHPTHIAANNQFILSQCVSLALFHTVSLFCDNVAIKWPNDLYVSNKKIAGILIENLLNGKHIASSIIGIGLNVNQEEFLGAENPISLKNITHKELNINEILLLFLKELDSLYSQIPQNDKKIQNEYLNHLYLKDQQATFKDKDGLFVGSISSVTENGQLHIIDEQGEERAYYFKEVEYQFF
ncbi:MAG: biotin--[acetyl-CoA-carboxylase] ligase [Bacteroidales bacterium]|nr:biotin--[acetyl-CoA-carboxylase] ligase [Bacteroidales bacterium]